LKQFATRFRQRNIAVLAALAVLDPYQASFWVDIADFEMVDFRSFRRPERTTSHGLISNLCGPRKYVDEDGCAFLRKRF